MISDHYDKTASVERLAIVEGNKKAYSQHLTGIACHLQPINDENRQDMEGAFGRELLMLSAIVDIAEGDQVTIDSELYRVMGTEALKFGKNPHRETRLKIFKSS